jgi:hypothetical protein
LDSLEENIPYTLMGEYNLMLYPYITRTCRSAYGGSCKVSKASMLCKKAHESLLL